MEMEIERLLDKLEEEIRIGKKPVFGGGKMIDDIKCLSIISQIRSSLPTVITEARVVLQDSNNIIESANMRAGEIVNKASKDAEIMLAQSNIIAQAQVQADEIIKTARQEANNIKNESYNSLVEMFNSAERGLKQTLDIVGESKQELYRCINRR